MLASDLRVVERWGGALLGRTLLVETDNLVAHFAAAYELSPPTSPHGSGARTSSAGGDGLKLESEGLG